MGCPHAATRFAGSSISHHLIIFRCQFGTVLLYRDTGGSRTRPQLGSSGQLLFVPFCLLFNLRLFQLANAARSFRALDFQTLREVPGIYILAAFYYCVELCMAAKLCAT